MTEIINRIISAPLNSPPLLIASIIYTIVESVRIYDTRLIQAKTRGFQSGVAAEAEGYTLPGWLGYVHISGWIILALIGILNWQFAIALYVVLFVFRVLPVLERIGAIIMHPFLQPELETMEEELSIARDQLSQARQDIEEQIHLIGPENKLEDFVPTFATWWMERDNQALNLEDALIAYILKFDLDLQKYADEPSDITMDRAKLAVLDASELSFDDDGMKALANYRMSLHMAVKTFELKRQLKDLEDNTDFKQE